MLPGVLVLSAACADAPPESTIDPVPNSLGEPDSEVAPARYLSHYLFAGVDGSGLFASFEQTTDEGSLARVYDAWWSGPEGWTELVSLRDTLPVPRAAWRVLPAAGMDVRVGDAREVVGFGFPAPDGGIELHAADEAAVWTGPTGQRESVSPASLDAGGESVGGILFFRRAARALQFAGNPGSSRGFLLADSAGNALLIETDEEDGTAVARTWLHGSVEQWSVVTLEADSTAAGAPPRRWRFEIPEAALSGTIRAIASPASNPVPAFRVECDLVADGDLFRFAGLSAPLPLP